MKKLILVLAILLAVPAFGALSISLQQQTPDFNKIDLNYAGADVDNLPRAFALNVQVTSSAKITAVTPSKTGESTAAAPGFGIFPATIDINTNGTVNSWGTPLAQTGDPGTGGTGLGTAQVVLEFGSLYVGDGNSPLTSGTLCTLTLDCNGTVGSVTVTATEEDTYRGGVVLEDGTAPSPNLSATPLVLSTLCGEICPGQASGPTPADHATGIAGSTNLSWTAGSDANSHQIYFGPNSVSQMVFVAEQSGTTYDPNPAGNLGQGRKWYWRIDEKNNCGIATGVVWDFNTQDCYNDPCTVKQNAWVAYGRPDCWCFQRQCRGDINGGIQGSYWVYTQDLSIMQAAFGKQTLPAGGICADLNHAIQGSYRVYTQDLSTLQTYFGKQVGSVPICDSNLVNFWTN